MMKKENIWPLFSVEGDESSGTIKTWLRLKNERDGKWYLCNCQTEYGGSIDKIYAIQRLCISVCRQQLFGLVGSTKFKDPISGEPIFVFDEECQLSEHGRWYLEDDMMFPKQGMSGPPIKINNHLEGVNEELAVLHKQFYPDVNG